ncbi:MAG TPA: potassium channel family protein, partial [Chondromyces sp.]|nr:potassium channel family protein [Chondromyces sp.]
MLQQLYYKFIEAPILIRFLGMALLVILASGLLIHLIEPETFPTVFEGVWWAVVTASTVGFGDYAPKTTPGRLVGMVLIFGGAGFLAAYFVNIAALAINAQNTLREGRTGYFNQNHLVIVGW